MLCQIWLKGEKKRHIQFSDRLYLEKIGLFFKIGFKNRIPSGTINGCAIKNSTADYVYYRIYSLTISLVISANVWAPHISMVSSSSAASFCVSICTPSAPAPYTAVT